MSELTPNKRRRRSAAAPEQQVSFPDPQGAVQEENASTRTFRPAAYQQEEPAAYPEVSYPAAYQEPYQSPVQQSEEQPDYQPTPPAPQRSFHYFPENGPTADEPEELVEGEDSRLPVEIDVPEEVADGLDAEAGEPHSIFKPRTKKPAFVLSVAVNAVRLLVLFVVLAGLAGVGAVVGIAKGYMETAPTLDLAALDDQSQTSFIYDCNDNLITEYKGSENRVMVSLAAMPTYLQEAFVAVEDSRFYTHNGIDPKRIVGAFVSNMSSSSTQGGSTITQQLIKNTVLSSEQSYKRKIQEAWLAMQLETQYSKDQILEAYLNTIYLGQNYYGVQTAAQGYFGKSLGELTLREAAMLAGTTNSPYYYDPRRNFYTRQKEGVDYPAITNDRTDYVLHCMYQCQFITYEQYLEALDPSTAHVLEQDPSSGQGMYPYAHYVEYAVKEVVDILLELNGLEDTAANRAAMENKLRTGGYRVKLALDPSIQSTLESTVTGWTQFPSLRDPKDKVFRSRNSDGTYTEIIQPQCAAVILDYRTGELKAMLGGRSLPTQKKTLNRATDMKMPVGSTIKPIAVYAPALELGASPASVVFNMPLPISGWKDAKGNDTFPKNYGGGGYKGPETLRTAMENSHNTAAAYTLMNLVGISNSVNFLHGMGVDDGHIDATPFGLSLGSSGITPMQMSTAYGVLANGGVYQKPISVLGISDSTGKVVWDGHAKQERYRVFSESTSYMIVDMLKQVVRSGTATKAKIKGQTVAGKTGTNSDNRGVSFTGLTGYYVSSIWVGHDNYKALSSKATASNGAIPLWQTYMAAIHKNLPDRDILDGDAGQYGVVKATTCAVSGQLATEACRADGRYGTVTDWWANGSQPTVPCQMHQVRSVCADSGMIASDFCPNVISNSVIVIPSGHPLYRFIGTEYNGVLEDYLGAWSTVKFDSGGGLVSGGTVCPYHTSYNPVYTDPMVSNTLIPDAQIILQQAYNQLQYTDPASPQYGAIYNAISNLEMVINSGAPSTADVAGAMSILTQAMAGLY